MRNFQRPLSVLMAAVLMMSLCILPTEAAGLTLGEPTALTQENTGVADTTKGNALLHPGHFSQEIPVGDR